MGEDVDMPGETPVDTHLTHCNECLNTVQEMKLGDGFERALVGAAGYSTPAPLEPWVARFIDRMVQESHLSAAVASSGTEESTLPGRVGRYQIPERIGSGGMGVVAKGFDPELQRTVAIKLPRFLGIGVVRRQAQHRFIRETRATAAVRHPNICPVYDVGKQDGTPYAVLAFVEGGSLQDRLRQGGRVADPQIAVNWLVQVAEGLAAVHAAGIVHRDLKPGNILLDGGQAMLTDFGLARVTSPDERFSSTGELIGTPAYMAPEQTTLVDTPLGTWTDQYALGVVLFELLTGRVPFEGKPLAVLDQIARQDVPSPKVFRPDLDAALVRIVLRAVARPPADRFPSIQAFADALRAWRDSPPS